MCHRIKRSYALLRAHMDYSILQKNWDNFSDAIEKIGGEVRVNSVEAVATEYEILALENKLGFHLPCSLRDVLLNFSRKVEFRWFMPDDFNLSGELSQIFCGDCHWSLDWIFQFNEDKNSWLTECFSNIDDPYDRVWHNKLAFHEVGNGDYLAIDLTSKNQEPVVYLSHDDGDGHGLELAPDFKSFIMAASRIGCVGGEDWQWLPFIDKEKPYLNPECENAQIFRSLLGLMA